MSDLASMPFQMIVASTIVRPLRMVALVLTPFGMVVLALTPIWVMMPDLMAVFMTVALTSRPLGMGMTQWKTKRLVTFSTSILQFTDDNVGLGTRNINWYAFGGEKEILERWVCIPFLVNNCTFKTHSAGGIRVHEEAAMDDNSWHCFRKGAGYFARIGGLGDTRFCND
jgi:hypothetical protein